MLGCRWIDDCLVPAGPPGCCKSSMVRVLADELGFDIVEWTAPTPTMWSEYKYQVGVRISLCWQPGVYATGTNVSTVARFCPVS